MLRILRIQNFVLINRLELNFESGFTVLTGETGAGKSILLNALNLLKGDRADFTGIGPKENKSIVEGEFDNTPEVVEFLEKNELEICNDLILRREIQKDGKSRAFINDTPVSLSLLKEVAQFVIAIHSQYNTLDLKDKNYQLAILDELSGTKSEAQNFRKDYLSFKSINKDIGDLQEKLSSLEIRKDYELYILEELSQLELDKFNYKDLEDELKQSERKTELLSLNQELLALSESELKAEINQFKYKIEKYKELDSNLLHVKDALSLIIDQLNEIGFIANKNVDKLESHDSDSSGILDKVDEYNRLLNKHRLSNQQELLQLQLSLSSNDSTRNDLIQQIGHLESKRNEDFNVLAKNSNELFNKRSSVLDQIHSDITSFLGRLKLESAKLVFELTKSESISENGGVEIQILFGANKGSLLVPIEKAASGGELSRVMLVLQRLISGKKALPSILFDEIDTGVSGDVAEKMGQMLKEMGKNSQLIAITHLPQVAAQASCHFKVSKLSQNDLTKTEVLELGLEERVGEVARLMSGEVITSDAIQTARNLMAIA